MPILILQILLLLLQLSSQIPTPYHLLPHLPLSTLPELPVTVDSSTLVINISLGTPGQPFRLVLDSQASDTFIPSKQCQLTAACIGHNTFDSGKSSSYKKNGMKFNDSDFMGYFGEDVISGLGVDKEYVVFGQVTKYGMFPHGKDYDGIVGLCNLPSQYNTTNFVRVLYQQGQIPSPSFSIYLSKSTTLNRLILGGINPTYNASSFTYHTLTPTKYGWSLPLTQLTLNNTKYRTPQTVVIDSGTLGIFGPSDLIVQLLEVFGGGSKEVKVDCAKLAVLPVMTLKIGNTAYKLLGEDYVARIDGQCVVGLFAMDLNPSAMIIGQSFMKAYYTHFDYEGRIGFASAK